MATRKTDLKKIKMAITAIKIEIAQAYKSIVENKTSEEVNVRFSHLRT